MSELGTLQERWDIYYRQFHLHSCMHHECIWTDGMWYFPEPGRRANTLHMFAPSRWGPINDYRYYDFHLPSGTMIEHMAWRYIGNGDPNKDWLQDYVAYDLNMVTVDMVVVDPNPLSN
ncbi:hypothetical protein CspeluHIS016_0202980 [Cutaneotrichosporon spelunceum]|uniref:Uncharacterized protein n=1 Tax=Cutaneotrichosporon spelunceum TaxID=1672016 RepID=A0AAD3TRN2_9TREE|nr:hypothetical protein CspeluHIS016_0202980 [Cutaneotrichosporon spelunceum]